MLTADDVAEFLSTTRDHVYRLIHSGDLNAVRVGRYYRVRPDDVEDFMVNNGTRKGGEEE